MYDQMSNSKCKTMESETDQRHPNFNKSYNMQDILCGSNQANPKYFIDSLQRFKKDYASCSKEEREQMRERRKDQIQKKQQHMFQVSQQFEQTNSSAQLKQNMYQNYRHQLFDMGIKKNGLTNGIPVNPINHQYINTYNGQKFQMEENQKKLNNMLRLHHLQTKGTCGYNLINGKQNTAVQALVPSEMRTGMDSRINQYNQHYTIKAPYF